MIAQRIFEVIKQRQAQKEVQVESPKSKVVIVGGKGEEHDLVAQANSDIKRLLRDHIQQCQESQTLVRINMRESIIEAERARVDAEVEELLAEEQRSFEMGGWA